MIGLYRLRARLQPELLRRERARWPQALACCSWERRRQARLARTGLRSHPARAPSPSAHFILWPSANARGRFPLLGAGRLMAASHSSPITYARLSDLSISLMGLFLAFKSVVFNAAHYCISMRRCTQTSHLILHWFPVPSDLSSSAEETQPPLGSPDPPATRPVTLFGITLMERAGPPPLTWSHRLQSLACR